LALKDGHADIVRELLKHGADTEHQGDGGWTALIAAARYGNPAMVEALVARLGVPSSVTARRTVQPPC
jgi:ankyrin repeat protein